jgi:hypothetical protein
MHLDAQAPQVCGDTNGRCLNAQSRSFNRAGDKLPSGSNGWLWAQSMTLHSTAALGASAAAMLGAAALPLQGRLGGSKAHSRHLETCRLAPAGLHLQLHLHTVKSLHLSDGVPLWRRWLTARPC